MITILYNFYQTFSAFHIYIIYVVLFKTCINLLEKCVIKIEQNMFINWNWKLKNYLCYFN